MKKQKRSAAPATAANLVVMPGPDSGTAAKPVGHTVEPVETALANYRQVPLTKLRESDTNPRRSFNEDRLAELAESIRIYGVQVPLKVTPDGDGYMVLAGARRYRAAKRAGIATLPVEVLSDVRDVVHQIELQLVENSEREGVHPMEEAEAYERLLLEGKRTVPELAAKTGKKPEHLTRLLQLCKLLPEARQLFLEDKLTFGHAKICARVPAARQLAAVRQCFKKDWRNGKDEPDYDSPVPLRDVERWVKESEFTPLNKAPFNLNDPKLVPNVPACSECPKCAAVNQMLFGDLVDGNVCTDNECYEVKRKTAVRQKVDSGYVALAGWKGNVNPDYPDAISTDECAVIQTGKGKEDKCESQVKAVRVAGYDVGEVVWICRDKKCPKHKERFRTTTGDSAATIRKRAEKERKDAIQKQFRHLLLEATLNTYDHTAGRGVPIADARMLAYYAYDVTYQTDQAVMRTRLGVGKAAGGGTSNRDGVWEKLEQMTDSHQCWKFALFAMFKRYEAAPYDNNDREDFLLDAATAQNVDVEALQAEAEIVVDERIEKAEARKLKAADKKAGKGAK